MKKILSLSLALLIILLSFNSCFAFDLLKKPKKGVEIVENVAEPLPEEEPVEEETEKPISIVLGDYLGDWHISGRAGALELRIHSVDSSTVEFSLWFKDSGEINNINAEIDGNEAAFDKFDSYGKIAGKLVFEETTIDLVIEESKVDYINTETLTFNGRHSDSYQDEANSVTTDTSSTVTTTPNSVLEPTTTVKPYVKYVSTGGDVLNLRVGPGIDYTSLLVMPHRSTVEVHGFNDDATWVYVYYREAKQYGWCSNEFLVYSLSEID